MQLREKNNKIKLNKKDATTLRVEAHSDDDERRAGASSTIGIGAPKLISDGTLPTPLLLCSSRHFRGYAAKLPSLGMKGKEIVTLSPCSPNSLVLLS